VPYEKAVVPVMDRGFLYGDSVYEVVRTYQKTTPFLLDRHYRRLLHSAEQIRLKIPFSLKQLEEHIRACIVQGDNPNSYVRIIVSRGEDDRFDLGHRPELKPKTILYVSSLPAFPKEYYSEGIHASLVSIRRNLRTALDPNIKSGNYLNNALALMEARER